MMYIDNCINSILRQTISDFELIIIDDGSTDKSASICEKYLVVDSRIKLVKQSNKGVSAARNAGLENATGKYICFIDVDDEAREDYLEGLLKDRELVFGHAIVIQNFTGYVGERKIIPYAGTGLHAITHIINNKILLFSEPYAKLFDNEIISKYSIRFPLDIHMGEDGIFVCEYLYFIDAVVVSCQNNYQRNITVGSLSGRLNDFSSELKGYLLWNESLLKLLNKYDEGKFDTQKVQWDITGNLFLRATRSLRKIDKIDARVALLKSIDEEHWKIFRNHKTWEVKSWVKKNLLKYKLFLIYALLLNLE